MRWWVLGGWLVWIGWDLGRLFGWLSFLAFVGVLAWLLTACCLC